MLVLPVTQCVYYTCGAVVIESAFVVLYRGVLFVLSQLFEITNNVAMCTCTIIFCHTRMTCISLLSLLY